MVKISHIPINIKIENIGEVKGELIQFLAPRTIDAIVRKLPFEGRAALLEHQVYFGIPVKVGKEKPRSTVEKGTIAYWPMGTAFCIYFEKTQPYSAVNMIGKVVEHIDLFKKVVSGTKIRIEKG